MSKTSIALVEDDRRTRDAWAYILDQHPGFGPVSTFESGEAFVLASKNLDSEVVLMDLELSGIDGVQALKKAREAGYKGLFLMLTVVSDQRRVLEALLAGASGYLLKACSPHELISAINDLTAGGSPMSASIAGFLIDHLKRFPPALEDKQPGSPRHIPLTEREMSVVQGLADGLLYKEIAAQHDVSINTIRSHIRRIYQKLHVNSAIGAINAALRD